MLATSLLMRQAAKRKLGESMKHTSYENGCKCERCEARDKREQERFDRMAEMIGPRWALNHFEVPA